MREKVGMLPRVLPFVGPMFIAIILCCIFPAIATAFSDALMGVSAKQGE